MGPEMSHFRGCPAGSRAARLEPEGPHEAAFPAGELGFGSGPERMDRLGELGVAPHPASALTRYARGTYVAAVPVGQSSFIIESPSRPRTARDGLTRCGSPRRPLPSGATSPPE